MRDPRAEPRSNSTTRGGARLLMSGKDAMSAASEIMAMARTVRVPTNMGDVELRPGQLFSQDRLLIYPSWSTVYFTIGDRLYEMGTSAFLRDEYLYAMSMGAQKAAWLIPIAKAEMALLTGIFVPWYLMLGMFCAKTTAIYLEHKDQFAVVWKHGPKALSALQKLRSKHPTLFSSIVRKVATEVITNLPSGVTGEDVGFLIGRILRGVDGLPQVTVGALVKVAAKVTLIVGALHLPNVAAHAAEAVAHQKAEEFRTELRDAGYDVTLPEAKQILREAMEQKDLESTLDEMEKAFKALAPSLETIEKALYE
jgi:hypothetical protein